MYMSTEMTGLTRQLCLSPSFAWSLLCICRRNAPPSCWTWHSSRWCSRCLRRRCRPCVGCTWTASRSWQSQIKAASGGFHKTVWRLAMAYPITIIGYRQKFGRVHFKFGKEGGNGKPNTRIHTQRKILSICEPPVLIHCIFKALLCVMPWQQNPCLMSYSCISVSNIEQLWERPV